MQARVCDAGVDDTAAKSPRAPLLALKGKRSPARPDSGIDNAWRLTGKLLMVVGEQDSHVDPGAEHSVGLYTGPIDYTARRQSGFFVRNLAGESTPNWNASEAKAP